MARCSPKWIMYSLSSSTNYFTGLENEKHFWFDVGKMKAPQKNFDEDSSQQKSPTMQGAEFHIYKHVKKTSNDTGEKKETDNHKFIEVSWWWSQLSNLKIFFSNLLSSFHSQIKVSFAKKMKKKSKKFFWNL